VVAGPEPMVAPEPMGVDAMFCEHANENPMICECPPDCYCQTRTCKDKLK